MPANSRSNFPGNRKNLRPTPPVRNHNLRPTPPVRCQKPPFNSTSCQAMSLLSSERAMIAAASVPPLRTHAEASAEPSAAKADRSTAHGSGIAPLSGGHRSDGCAAEATPCDTPAATTRGPSGGYRGGLGCRASCRPPRGASHIAACAVGAERFDASGLTARRVAAACRP